MPLRFDAVHALCRSLAPELAEQRGRRVDAADLSMFAETQLRQVIAKTYDRRFANLTAKQHIPTGDHGINRAAMAWAFQSWDMRGEARILGANVNDIPRVDVGKGIEMYPLRTMWDAYAYTIEELEAANYAGVALESRKAVAARRAIDVKQNQVLYFGSPEDQIPGLLTNPMVPRFTVPNGNWLGGGATAEDMVEDLMALADSIEVGSNQLFAASVIGLPLLNLRMLSRKTLSGTSVTALKHFLDSNGKVAEVVSILELATAGPGGTPMAIAYEKNEENLAGIEPLPFTQESPQTHGMETVVPCRARTGGTVVFNPAAIVFGDGI